MSNVFEVKETVEQWDEDYYQPIALRLYDRAIADMLNFMQIDADATILDAGCGPGVHSIRAAKAGYRMCAIDLSNEMLGHARARAAAQHVADRIEFHQKDLTNLDFADASFRYVFSWGVVIHIPDAERALDELARIVQPGGKLALYLTNKGAIDHKIESIARRILGKKPKIVEHLPLGDGSWYPYKGERIWVWLFDAAKITGYLGARGFRLIVHRTGEATEIQRRVHGIFRNWLLRFNNLAYRLKFPASLANGQLMIFEKTLGKPSIDAGARHR